MENSPGFAAFFAQRNFGESPLIDHYVANILAVPIGYAAACARITANQLSIASGLFALAALAAAVFAPAAEAWTLIILYVLAQTAYVLDCADGQLARATGTATRFGAFLDHGLDALSGSVVSGALFWLLYRQTEPAEATGMRDWILAIGFIFIALRSASFFVGRVYADQLGSPGAIRTRVLARRVIGELSSHQVSLFGILLALYSVTACLALFALQATMMMRSYVRYLLRAYRHLED